MADEDPGCSGGDAPDSAIVQLVNQLLLDLANSPASSAFVLPGGGITFEGQLYRTVPALLAGMMIRRLTVMAAIAFTQKVEGSLRFAHPNGVSTFRVSRASPAATEALRLDKVI